jgi:hypothetical protein
VAGKIKADIDSHPPNSQQPKLTQIQLFVPSFAGMVAMNRGLAEGLIADGERFD